MVDVAVRVEFTGFSGAHDAVLPNTELSAFRKMTTLRERPWFDVSCLLYWDS